MKLFEYQEEAVSFCVENHKTILRLDTGLGKTAVAVSTANTLADMMRVRRLKVLVIVPAFLKRNWNREIKLWSPKMNLDVDWSVISYSKAAIARYTKDIIAKEYDLVICDEAHYLKSWSAKRTKVVIKKILIPADRVMLLTATPYVTSAEDLHSLFSVCQPGQWGTLGEFRKQFCQWKPNPFSPSPYAKIWYGAKNVDEIKERSTPFMFSRKKADVYSQLPDKRISDIEFDVGKEFSLDAIADDTYVNERGVLVGGLSSVIAKANAELGLAKVPKVLEFIENSSIKKFVVFCKHKDVARALSENLKCSLITGDTPMRTRDETIEMFQDGDTDRLVATIGAIGVGVNLQSCSTGIFAELPWSYAELKQCEDRLHRIGQKNKVLIYRFIASDTIDDLIVNQLNQKFSGEESSIGVY